MSELAFFIGKGGVGKTTVSAAYAVHASAQRGSRDVLLISTDPAHSLCDVLETKGGPRKREVPLRSRGSLKSWEIDSASLFQQFLREHKLKLVQIIEQGSFFKKEEISSFLESALPGMSEIAALLAIEEAVTSRSHSSIVVDTAPFGHTLRLFSLPEQFQRLLNFLELSADRDRVLAQHFGGGAVAGPNPFVAEWRQKLDRVREAFQRAKLFLVTTAEKFSLNESVRCMTELTRSNPEMKLAGIVLNRVVGRPGACSRCKLQAKAAVQARKELRKSFPAIPLYTGFDPGTPISGTSSLKRFAGSLFSNKPLAIPKRKRISRRKYELEGAQWPGLEASITFVLGKGGVGKTTIAAALGFDSRRRARSAVEICSVDPAPSLDDVFQTPVDGRSRPVLGDNQFRASELDSFALFREWIQSLRAEVDAGTSTDVSGVHLDLSFEKKLFAELLEIVPPGLDEILAVFRIIDLAQSDSQRVIIDMAPTGHALQLLRMPAQILTWSRLLLKSLAAHRKLALAREAAVKIAELEVRALELSESLRDLKRVAVFAVMLPEPLPDRETERLLRGLSGLQLRSEAIFVNRVLLPEAIGKCLRCKLQADGQSQVLAKLQDKAGDKPVFVVPEYDHEISGKRGLKEICSSLWRLN